MTLFDLLLILVVLGTGATVVAAAIALAVRRWAAARRLGWAVVLVWTVYLGVGTFAAAVTAQRVMAIGQDRCFDEMCFAVTGFQRVPSVGPPGKATQAGGVFVIVDVRMSNRSQRHAQREAGRKGVLLDSSGRVYEVSLPGAQALATLDGPLPGLDARVDPGQSLATRLVFDVPADAHPAFALASGLAFNPARIVIGDEDHFLHKRTIVPLD